MRYPPFKTHNEWRTPTLNTLELQYPLLNQTRTLSNLNQSISPWSLQRLGGGFVRFRFPRCGSLFSPVSSRCLFYLHLSPPLFPCISEGWSQVSCDDNPGFKFRPSCLLSTRTGSTYPLPDSRITWLRPLLMRASLTPPQHIFSLPVFSISHIVGRFVVDTIQPVHDPFVWLFFFSTHHHVSI